MGNRDSSPGEMGNISHAINHLGIYLYKELIKEKENVFFSPFSISCALAMVFEGAKKETAEEMRKVLGYETAKIPDEEVKLSFQRILLDLEKTPDSYTLNAANMALIGLPIKKEYKKSMEDSFKALMIEVNFQRDTEKIIQKANEWVKDKTNKMIPKLIDKLNPATVMVLLNAVYFKGFWKYQFSEKETYLQVFYNKGLKENANKVKMMHLRGTYAFVERKSFQALQMPYKGNEIAMLILLPRLRDGLEKLEKDLSNDFLKCLKAELRKVKVSVDFPKFRLEYSKSVQNQFQDMGMNLAFQTGADFGGISDGTLCISEIIHKAVLEVNEEGSEASAATAVVMLRSAPSSNPYRDFTVDHPFLFLIYNIKNDLTLFMGKVDELKV